MSVLAIDFGTSRIKAAYWDLERSEAAVLPLGNGGRLYVPSLFHVNRDGRIRFGDEAEVMLFNDSSGIIENLKLDLDKPYKHVPNGQRVKSLELLALLFGRIIAYAVSRTPFFGGKAPETIVLTRPSRWDYEDIYLEALSMSGYEGKKIIIREPEAAGLACMEQNRAKPGAMLMVLDFGGGTVDWACLRVDEKGLPVTVPELPPGGITAAGSHVDAGLFDEMMQRLGEEQRAQVMQQRGHILDQIRRMKEFQSDHAGLSGEARQPEVYFGQESFVFEHNLFGEVVQRTVVDHAVEGIGGYAKKVAKVASENGSEVWCVMAGGTRLLTGLEEKIRERIRAIARERGITVQMASVAQADFATVRGAVLRGVPARPVHIEVKKPEEQRQPSPQLPVNFVLIKGGTFMMGSPESEVDRSRDETLHEVRVSDFAMCRYAVTQKEWQSVSGSNHSTFKGGNLPVDSVSWDDCQDFIKRLNQKTGQIYRLPTEAEWEYACRAGTTTPFNTGENLTTDQANYNGNYPYRNYPKGDYLEKTVPVDHFEPNAWGLYNMHGNVWEWCADWYGETYYEECRKQGLIENPQGSTKGSRRVLRGGSWNGNARYCRSAYRLNGHPGNRLSNVGFRLVFVPQFTSRKKPEEK